MTVAVTVFPQAGRTGVAVFGRVAVRVAARAGMRGRETSPSDSTVKPVSLTVRDDTTAETLSGSVS
jgi:hypothetical protein